jgi:hypothetical protein
VHAQVTIGACDDGDKPHHVLPPRCRAASPTPPRRHDTVEREQQQRDRTAPQPRCSSSAVATQPHSQGARGHDAKRQREERGAHLLQRQRVEEEARLRRDDAHDGSDDARHVCVPSVPRGQQHLNSCCAELG